MAQLRADAAKLESRAASYRFGYQPLGPSLMCSSQAEGTTEASLRQGYSERSKLLYRKSHSIGSSTPMQRPAEVELRFATTRWELLGWKRPADEIEGAPEISQVRRDQAGAARKRMFIKIKAKHPYERKPANIRAVPKIFPH